MLGRSAAQSLASHVPVDQPLVAFVATTAQAAMSTLDRVASVGQYRPSVTYPNNGFGQALQVVAGAMSQRIGTKVFFVQTGGFDNHAGQDTTGTNGTYVRLMATLNDGLAAFYNDLRNTGLLNDTLILSFSEFGRRVGENGSRGTDHGAASVIMVHRRRRARRRCTARRRRSTRIPRTLRSRTTGTTSTTKPISALSTPRSSTTGLAADSAAVLGGNFRVSGINFI